MLVGLGPEGSKSMDLKSEGEGGQNLVRYALTAKGTGEGAESGVDAEFFLESIVDRRKKGSREDNF